MSIVKPYLDNLEKMKDELEPIAQQALRDNYEFVTYLITERQWALGQDSSGAIIGRYAPQTEEWAKDPWNKPRREKEAGQPYNLDWTGELFENLALKMEKDSFSIFSTTGKAQFLEREFGTKITKLTEENNREVNEQVILPALYNHILKNLFNV